MVIKKRKFLFLKSLRIVFDDEALKQAMQEKKYHYITGVSYNKFDFGLQVKMKKKQTAVLDLSRTLDDIFFAFAKNTRNEINKTKKMPDLKIALADKNFKEIKKLYSAFAPDKKIVNISSCLSEFLFFSAYYKNQLISCIACYYNENLRAKAIFSARSKKDKEFQKIIGYTTRRLVWEICKYGKERKFKLFDLGGVNFKDPAKKGITNFKMSFNGRVIDEYHYIYKGKIFKWLM